MSVSCNVPFRAPILVALKVMLSSHLLPAWSVLPQLLDSVAPPVIVILEIVRALEPVLVSVIVRVPLVPTIWFRKLAVVAESDTTWPAAQPAKRIAAVRRLFSPQ